MGDMANEPSMEDILSSIKKIIAEDDAKAAPAKARGRAERAAASPAEAADDSVLELTQNAPDTGDEGDAIVSPDAAAASRLALSNLSRLIVKPEVSGSDTLEGLVRELLKPMLKDWLDAHLPAIVERVVAQEVARITGQSQG
ncbi:MAG: hypothetical protein RJB22_1767 [Pseudomonadota bacterium]|jgi:cell pole-organizing protein PopZ